MCLELVTVFGASAYNRWIVNIYTGVTSSVSEPEPPGAATFRVEPEPIFLLAGAGAAAPAAFFGKHLVTKHDLRTIYNGKCDPKKNCINNSLFKSSI